MVEQEERDLAGCLPEIERALQILLLPRDEADARNAILCACHDIHFSLSVLQM